MTDSVEGRALRGSLAQGWTDAEIVTECEARVESPARFYANPVTESQFVMALAAFVWRSRSASLPSGASSAPAQQLPE